MFLSLEWKSRGELGEIGRITRAVRAFRYGLGFAEKAMFLSHFFMREVCTLLNRSYEKQKGIHNEY